MQWSPYANCSDNTCTASWCLFAKLLSSTPTYEGLPWDEAKWCKENDSAATQPLASFFHMAMYGHKQGRNVSQVMMGLLTGVVSIITESTSFHNRYWQRKSFCGSFAPWYVGSWWCRLCRSRPWTITTSHIGTRRIGLREQKLGAPLSLPISPGGFLRGRGICCIMTRRCQRTEASLVLPRFFLYIKCKKQEKYIWMVQMEVAAW